MANFNITTSAKLYSYKGDTDKKWFIGFTFKSKRYQIRMGLNFIKNQKERMAMGKDICNLVNAALQDGWDPEIISFEKYIEQEADERKDGNINKQSFDEALTFGMENGSWSAKTKLCYKSTVDFYKEAATKLGLAHRPITEITKQHIMQLTRHVKNDRNWSNKAVNKNVIYLAAVLKVVKDWDIIPHNPAHDIRRLPVTESEKFLPYRFGCVNCNHSGSNI